MRISDCVRRAAQVNADGPATRFGSRTRSWDEVGLRVACLAGGLRRLGVGSGTRVAILALNSDRYVEYLLAVPWAGAVFVPVNTRLAPPETRFWLSDSGSSVLIVDDAFLEVARSLREADTPTGFVGFDELIERSSPIDQQHGDGRELAGIFYTGGTTGRSKGVMHSHDGLLSSALHLLGHLRWNGDTNYLHAAPMFHLADGAGMFATLLVAGCHTAIPRFTARAMAESVHTSRVTASIVVPTMINMLVHDPVALRYDLSSLTTLAYGGSPIPESVLATTGRLLPHVQLYQLFGQTEAAPTLALLGPEYHVFDGPRAGYTRSAGQAVIGCEVTILDADGRELPRGRRGEICGRGDNIMLGYWNQPGLTEQALRGGWLHTGDLGYMDTDGFVFVVDRLKDMIVTGGENVYSIEVENALYAHPSVAECAVIGIPHDRWGEQVHATVRLQDNHELTRDDLLAHCRQLIANYKVPRSVEFRRTPLPTSGAGKILKSELRKPYRQAHAQPQHRSIPTDAEKRTT